MVCRLQFRRSQTIISSLTLSALDKGTVSREYDSDFNSTTDLSVGHSDHRKQEAIRTTPFFTDETEVRRHSKKPSSYLRLNGREGGQREGVVVVKILERNPNKLLTESRLNSSSQTHEGGRKKQSTDNCGQWRTCQINSVA